MHILHNIGEPRLGLYKKSPRVRYFIDEKLVTPLSSCCQDLMVRSCLCIDKYGFFFTNCMPFYTLFRSQMHRRVETCTVQLYRKTMIS